MIAARPSGDNPGREWWTRPVPALVAAHVALAGTFQARPGLLAVYLWYLGPSLVALAAIVLLAVALVESLRHRASWSWRRMAGLAGLALAVGAVPLYQTYPSSHDGRPSSVRFRLPLDGPVTVAWGGATREVNYHVGMPDQRWAYDLLVTSGGRSARGAGTELGDFLAFDRPVRAPAAGLVRTAHDGEADEAPGAHRARGAFGNHVILEVVPGEYLFIAHLRRGSIRVRPGERVAAGEVIARVGNSGNSSEPHVHVHLQDTPYPHLGEAIPFEFAGYRRQDGTVVDRGMPEGGVAGGRYIGEIVEHVAGGAGEARAR
jgi:murein DD-endopeptidase MepM/ murein hydrolase activator NlpD